MTHQEILNLPVRRADLDSEITIGQYLHDLLKELWVEEDGFSGKRSFGNSGWKYDIYSSLIKHGVIPGKLDEDGYIDEFDDDMANQFVVDNIINPLFNK